MYIVSSASIYQVAFYVISNNGSVLLFCATKLALCLIQSYTRLDYLPPRASLITYSADHPKKTKCQPPIHVSTRACTASIQLVTVPKLITSKDQILQVYPEVLDGIGHFPGPPYPIHINQHHSQPDAMQTSTSTSQRNIQAIN